VTNAVVKHFVITGCARSGTGYTAELLTRLGLTTEHETVFSPYTEAFPGWGAAPGESSWLAAPFIHQLPPGTVVLHQLRHPDAVVRSLLGIHFFDREVSQVTRDVRSLLQVARARGLGGLSRRLLSGQWRGRGRRLRSDFVGFVERHCPEVFERDDELERCETYWLRWNGLVEEQASQAEVAYKRYRIEELDADLVMELLDLLGEPLEKDAVVAALDALPTSVNTRPTTLHPGPSERVSSELVAAARRYGYDMDQG
jgi:hypothetical protein